MSMEITGNYGSYTATYADGTKKAAADSIGKSQAEVEKSKNEQNKEYMSSLEKLAPSVKFGLGYGLSSAKYGKTLQINPKLLEKMQNDPEQEKEMKELIAGVEKAMKIAGAMNKAGGWETKYSHWYIDENGKCWHSACTVKDDTMNKKLREQSRKNSEKLIEKTRANAKKKKKELQELLEKKKTEQSEAEQILKEKMEAAKDGIIYMDDADTKKLMEAINEADKDISNRDKSFAAGTAIDMYL